MGVIQSNKSIPEPWPATMRKPKNPSQREAESWLCKIPLTRADAFHGQSMLSSCEEIDLFLFWPKMVKGKYSGACLVFQILHLKCCFCGWKKGDRSDY